jgi:hypothetical protein
MIIGCDLGGVVKEMFSNEPILDAIKTIKEFEIFGHEVIFISKCKEGLRENIIKWLKDKELNNKIFFCSEYSEKCDICIKYKVNVMIDDKLQVFKEIPDSIKKFWFCSDYKKINYALKNQTDEFYKVVICKNWIDILKNIYL